MILLDTNVLIAIVNPADGYHSRVMDELEAIECPFFTCDAVLTESFHMLDRPNLRARLMGFVSEAPIAQLEPAAGSWPKILAWMVRYHEHHPAFADAVLVHLLQVHKRAKVWTLDREFSTIWGMSTRVVQSRARKRRR